MRFVASLAAAAVLALSGAGAASAVTIVQSNGQFLTPGSMVTRTVDLSAYTTHGHSVSNVQLSLSGLAFPIYNRTQHDVGQPYYVTSTFSDAPPPSIDQIEHDFFRQDTTDVFSNFVQDTLRLDALGDTASGSDAFGTVSTGFQHTGQTQSDCAYAGPVCPCLPTDFFCEFTDLYTDTTHTGFTGPLDASMVLSPGALALLNTDGQLHYDGKVTSGFIRVDDLTVTFDVNSVPEPATWVLMILGAALAGMGLRRQRFARPT